MINIDFLINNRNNIRRIDANPIIASSSNYQCNFTFEGEQWEGIEKYVVFKTNKNKSYTASLGTEMQSSSPIPQAALSGCIMKVSVYGGDLITTNEVSVLVIPTGYTTDTSTQDSEFKDAFKEAYDKIKEAYEIVEQAYQSIEGKFDDVTLEDDNILSFYASGDKIATINLNPLIASQHPSWNSIEDKPRILTHGVFYRDTYLLKLYDNTNLIQSISLEHSHVADDITDLELDIDTDLNQLLTHLTQNIRSL